MLIFDPKAKAIANSGGGYPGGELPGEGLPNGKLPNGKPLGDGLSNAELPGGSLPNGELPGEGLLPIRDTFVKLSSGLNFQHGVLYEPAVPCEKSRIGVVAIHSGADYSAWDICGELAKRGYRVLGGQVSDPGSSLDSKMLDVRRTVDFMRCCPGVEKVALIGHSGGATLMTAYQRAAENGADALRGEEMLIKCSVAEALPPADGIMLLDSNWGNGAMTLFSIDPAVVEGDSGMKLDPELDIFSPANGYDPEGARYSEAFKAKFFRAQAERGNCIVGMALERLHALESGKGRYIDDEPLAIAGAAQFGPCNKLFPQDLSLLARTKQRRDLIHRGGAATNEIVHSVRRPRFGKSQTPSISAALQTTVRCFLSERAAIALPDEYRVGGDGVYGIDWRRCYCCPPSNIQWIRAPLLCMGMTAGYEYLAAEEIYSRAASEDKTIAFVEGATHNFHADAGYERFPGQFGDTRKTLCDFVDKWLGAGGRFIG